MNRFFFFLILFSVFVPMYLQWGVFYIWEEENSWFELRANNFLSWFIAFTQRSDLYSLFLMWKTHQCEFQTQPWYTMESILNVFCVYFMRVTYFLQICVKFSNSNSNVANSLRKHSHFISPLFHSTVQFGIDSKQISVLNFTTKWHVNNLIRLP